nr:hypothetical protein [Tanacetum cinerariifolium]
MTKALVPREELVERRAVVIVDGPRSPLFGLGYGVAYRAGHDGLVGKIGLDDGLVHKQWVEMGLFGAVVGL